MEEIKIESGVPMPLGYSHKSKWADLFKQMKVGDSFLVPLEVRLKVVSLSSNINFCARQLGMKAKTRTTPEGIRVWRVK